MAPSPFIGDALPMPRFKMIQTAREFLHWLDRASPGDTVVYHVGDLSYDRIGGSPGARQTAELADTAFEYSRSFELHLLQARLGMGVFEYRAVKTSPKNTTKLEKWLARPVLSAHGVQPLHTREMPPLKADLTEPVL